MGSILFWKILGNKLDPDSSQNNFQSILFGQRHGSIKMVRPVWGIIMSPSDLYSCFYRKLTYGYQISGIFIGSPDTGYQLIYLHYQIRSMNTSSNKNFPSTSAAIKNRLAAELDTLALALDLNTRGIHLFFAVSVLELQRLVLS